MIVSGALPARQRLDLYVWLLVASDPRAASLLGDADRALAQGRRPRPALWTEDVHFTVGEQLPTLLPRWEDEPPAARFVLAYLAGLHPHHGQRVGDQITRMAQQFHGTRQGVCLLLAEALIHTQDDQALALTADITAWKNHRGPVWLDAEGVTIPVKAGHVLVEAALRALSSVEGH